ncbi:tol-pal system YbgF family protein [Dysgonomonas sp. ZJ709]|uniref:tetratricopeptide repeat protein n=1 Tax=Dysgonomonas sp. ZJ709 TaxID=2709797 RepID=UPI0013EC4DF4|nr:tetratricopeptide repeat protein [Dysgonomonas sp. ZJ709]
MRAVILYILLSLGCATVMLGQTLTEAKELYNKGEFEKALPLFEGEYNAKPTDASINFWYGACLFETNQNLKKAEEALRFASTKRIQDSFLYLGMLYTNQYRFSEARDMFSKYEALLKKKDDAARANLEEKRKLTSRLNRMVSNTEDVQIIDSIVVDKAEFLSAYKMSTSSGRLDYFNKVFTSSRPVESTVYFNEKGTKIYYGQPLEGISYSLFSMEKLLDDFGNEKELSATNFGLEGDVNYPYMMADGVTIYFAARDEESIGGYDLFVSRYNMNNDTFLTPERLNMPFNSLYNDYMMVVDEEKGVGWFASDRFQREGKVCVYTFIPNGTVKIISSDDEQYLAGRAHISSIKSSWIPGTNYSKLITLARKDAEVKEKVNHDFEFVINDTHTYYSLGDFKSKPAREAYTKVQQLKNELNTLDEKLESERVNYIGSSQEGKRRISASILNMEKRQEQLQKEIPLMEIQARNQEIQLLK